MRSRWQPRRSVELVTTSGSCGWGVALTLEAAGEALAQQ